MMLGPSLDIFGDKWGIEILVCAFFRVRRFTDLRDCTGISANILSDRLERFVTAGILTETVGGAAEQGYGLTEKGVDLYGVIVAIQGWADQWLSGRIRSPVLLIHRRCGAVFQPATTCGHCLGVVQCLDVRFR